VRAGLPRALTPATARYFQPDPGGQLATVGPGQWRLDALRPVRHSSARLAVPSHRRAVGLLGIQDSNHAEGVGLEHPGRRRQAQAERRRRTFALYAYVYVQFEGT